MDSRLALALSLAMLWVSVARAEADKVRVTVVVAGAGSAQKAIEARMASQNDVSVEVRVVPVPVSKPASKEAADPAIAEALSAARTRYVEADFEACLARLPDDAAFLGLFARGDVTTVARALMYRAACQAGRGATEEARRSAQTFARFGLETPSDVGSVTPEVERILTDALRQLRAAPRASLRVQSEQVGLEVAVDGRALGCRTPCAVELAPGDHVVALSGDGITSHVQRVRLASAGSSVMLKTTRASPELAERQWIERYADRPGLDSAESLALLAQAVRAPRLVLISSERAGQALLNLRGAYEQDGAMSARAGAERVPVDEAPDESVRLLRDLLVHGKTLEPPRPLWKSGWFWVSVGVVAAGAATTTALLLREPKQRTQVEFQ